jgi:hypothetical protein
MDNVDHVYRVFACVRDIQPVGCCMNIGMVEADIGAARRQLDVPQVTKGHG